jgi:hypothetical protein
LGRIEQPRLNAVPNFSNRIELFRLGSVDRRGIVNGPAPAFGDSGKKGAFRFGITDKKNFDSIGHLLLAHYPMRFSRNVN